MSQQESLFQLPAEGQEYQSTQPQPRHDPAALPDFDGATYSRKRDHVRLGKQAFAVWAILLDGMWHTLRELSERTGYPEASISARIRDLRKRKFGGHIVEHENLGRGTWRYRLLRQGAPVSAKVSH